MQNRTRKVCFMDNVISQLRVYIAENYERSDSCLLFHFYLPKVGLRKKITKQVPKQIKVSTAKQTNEAQKAPQINIKPPLKLEKPDRTKTKGETPFASVYKRIAPSIAMHTAPPQDSIAKRIKHGYKDRKILPDIPIFISTRLKAHEEFLTNISAAIDTVHGKSAIYDITSIESENRWENIFTSHQIKWLILPQELLQLSPNLKEHFRDVPGQPFQKIAHIPALVLENLNQYYLSPEKKKTLWKSLNELFTLC